MFRFRTKEAMFVIRKVIEGPLPFKDAMKGQGGCDINFPKLIQEGYALKFFQLHGPMLAQLTSSWGTWDKVFQYDYRTGLWPHHQPIDDIRDYFGERIAMYFSFLGYLTGQLYLPAFLGVIVFLLEIIFPDSDFPMLCHSFFLVGWMLVFCQTWKQAETKHALRWGTLGYDKIEEPRPLFEGTWDKATDSLQHADHNVHKAKVATAFQLSLLYGATVAFTMLAILWFRNILIQEYGTSMGTVAGVVNAVAITIFDAMYREVGVSLTDWENHRTQTSWEDSHVSKSFLFQFVNRYLALFVTAFVFPFEEFSPYFGSCPCLTYVGPLNNTHMYNAGLTCTEDDVSNKIDGCECKTRNCRGEVSTLMLMIFLVNIFVQNGSELLLPTIMSRFKQHMEGMVIEDEDDIRDLTRMDGGYSPKDFNDRDYSVAEEEAAMEEYGEVEIFEDYAELVIQIGYVTFFALAFPLAALLSLFNNVVEIRCDASKLCTVYQRPAARRAESIGGWYQILVGMSLVAISSNAAYSCFYTNFFLNRFALSDRIWMFFGIEHVLLAVRLQLALYLPSHTHETQLCLDKEYATQKRAEAIGNRARMEQIYGEKMKTVMDNYEYVDDEPRIVDVSKDVPIYADVKYSLNMGMAMIRSHNVVDGSVSQTLDADNLVFPYTPGEKSFDKRMGEFGAYAPKHRSFLFDNDDRAMKVEMPK